MTRNNRGGPPRRTRGAATKKRELLVFVEGLRTEEQYLKHWHRHHREHVVFTIDNFRGEPLSLVQHAHRAKQNDARDERRGRGDAYDEYWCVFDRDDHERFEQAIALAEQSGINLAVSNPCIELWFILHFERQTAYIDRFEAQRRARKLLDCDKTLTDKPLDQLVDRHDDAAGRAKALDDMHRRNGSGRYANPSSGTWRIIDSIRNAASRRLD